MDFFFPVGPRQTFYTPIEPSCRSDSENGLKKKFRPRGSELPAGLAEKTGKYYQKWSCT